MQHCGLGILGRSGQAEGFLSGSAAPPCAAIRLPKNAVFQRPAKQKKAIRRFFLFGVSQTLIIMWL